MSVLYYTYIPRQTAGKTIGLKTMTKQAHFDTLNTALESENLLDSLPPWFQGIAYGETYRYQFNDNSKYGRQVSITRFNNGKYERPVHYKL